MTDCNVTYAGCGVCETCGEIDPCATCVGDWVSDYDNISEDIKDTRVIRIAPPTITGTKKGDRVLLDMLGDMGALAGSAKEAYEERRKR